MAVETTTLKSLTEEKLVERNQPSRVFFDREAARLASTCREMAERFLNGGRLLAVGRGAYASDAQHVSVEFVHPVIVGKRALPALDLSHLSDAMLKAVLRESDIFMGFGPPEGDPAIEKLTAFCSDRGSLTFALPGSAGSYATPAPSKHPFIHQELIEILYHTLWETVHVFFEHRERGHDVGASGFLYPFLGSAPQDTSRAVEETAASILEKSRDVETLREEAAAGQAQLIAEAAAMIASQVGDGGQIICMGNGGSATDANDFVFDCVAPPESLELSPLPALSLSLEPANISAIANDIGAEAIFLRQLIAQAGDHDVVLAFSTSGGSRNIILALEEARKRGLPTVAFLGYDGGEILRKELADFPILVRCDYIPRIQEIHASMYHVLRELIDLSIHG